MTPTNAERLLAVALELWWSVIASAEPRNRALYERMRAPRDGDFVVETTGFATDASARVGRLLRRAREPLPNWDIERDGPNAGEDVWYIQTEAGEIRWTNASFVAVPPAWRRIGPRNQVDHEGWPP